MTEKIDKLIEYVKDKTKCEVYNIKIENEKPSIFDSKIGGLPYWTTDKEYPKNSKGNKLYLLAQINFDKCEVDDPLPKNGLLQFFISDDDLMGMNFDEPFKQDGYRVIYHENVDYNITEESIIKADIPDSKNNECLPVTGECKISLHKNIDYMSPDDFRFDKLFPEAYKEVYGQELPKDKKFYFDVLNDEEENILLENLSSKINHKMLGYPYFTQTDPRYGESCSSMDTLLFQLDSENKYIMWGDAGIGNFFINKESLLKKRF